MVTREWIEIGIDAYGVRLFRGDGGGLGRSGRSHATRKNKPKR